MNIPKALRSPERTLYNYSVNREQVKHERGDGDKNNFRRIGFAGLIAVGVVTGFGITESNNQEPEQTTRIHSFETVE